MMALIIVLAVVFFMFVFVVIFGAPYLPTLKRQRLQALDLLDLKPGQLFIDLGSGDGTMLALAASRGLRAVGYEINPLLVAYSWLRTRRYGSRVQVKMLSLWRADLAQADGVFVFLITHHMKRLDQMLSARKGSKKLKVVSNSSQSPAKNR